MNKLMKKAKEFQPCIHTYEKIYTKDELELVLEWCKGNLKHIQIQKALNLEHSGQVYGFLTRGFKQLFKSNILIHRDWKEKDKILAFHSCRRCKKLVKNHDFEYPFCNKNCEKEYRYLQSLFKKHYPKYIEGEYDANSGMHHDIVWKVYKEFMEYLDKIKSKNPHIFDENYKPIIRAYQLKNEIDILFLAAKIMEQKKKHEKEEVKMPFHTTEDNK